MQPDQQTPSQLPPDPNLPPAQPVRRTVIQPLSSEEEIRQAAATSGAPARPSEPGVNPAGDYSPDASEYESTAYQNAYDGSLVAEPIHQVNQAPLPYSVPKIASPVIAAQPEKPVTKIVIIVLSVLVVCVLGLAAWLFLFNRVSPAELAQENVNVLDRELPTELVEEAVGQSAFLRPKDWTRVSETNSYENAKTEGEEPTAIVTMNEFSPDSALDAMYKNRDELQKWYMEELPDNVLLLAIYTSTPMECDKKTLAVTRREDATKNKTTMGVISADATCQKEDGTTITMKMRIVTGLEDKRERMIVVAATELEWLKNERTFQQMLDSVEEHKAA